jgi:hypothetical protein
LALKRLANHELVRCYSQWLVCQRYSLLLYQIYAPVHVATN